MASLKRLLNPTDDYEIDGVDRRPQPAWTESGDGIDADPVLQNLPWPDYVEQLIGQSAYADGFTQYQSEDDFESDVISHAQHQIEQLVIEDDPLPTALSTPQSMDDDEQICLGMLHRVSVKLRGNMSELDSKLRSASEYSSGDRHEMILRKPDDRYIVIFPDNEVVMGELSLMWERAFDSIEVLGPIYECLAPIRDIRDTIAKTTEAKEAITRLDINIYSNRGNAHQIGRELSSQKVYLQRPYSYRPRVAYDNPHFLKLKTILPVSEPCNPHVCYEAMEQEKDKVDVIKETVVGILSSLRRGEGLVALEGDRRLTTELLPHQKKGLDFMIQRERGPIPEEYLLWKPDQLDGKLCYRHTVCDAISFTLQSETGGGILADEMGMGKTLAVLALVLQTLEEAHQWASKGNLIPGERKRAGATLIIASSDIMISEWKQEMEKHFDIPTVRALRTIKYHGQTRETDLDRLREADIIITTYHTLSADFRTQRNPLKGLEWYRIVLDEAHIIRRQNTGLYKTVVQLKAKSRWCLTGTPIQNCFEDIGSLFAFLRINPLHSMTTFRTSIVIPFNEGGKRRKLAIERLTRIIESLCLHRKKKDELELPAQYDIIREIEFSPAESAQYLHTKTMMDRAIRNQVGVFDLKGALGHFQMLLQLRIICNHGTYQHPFSWNRRKLHLLEEKEAMESLFGGDSQVTCSNCKQSMPMFGDGSTYRRYSDRCRHVVCLECIEESMLDSEQSLPSNCPLCASLGFFGPSHQTSHRTELESYFRPDGHSSKMERLMQDVVVDLARSKSIIFSHWTRTLDLIETHLNRCAVVYRRIDGECPTKKRQKILEEFANDPTVRVLIMTTGTGAVGLNLATANRVFLVEPQWNPSVEKQAIARALRIGQEHSVQVTRYIVAKTVEQDMKLVQDRKLEIAGIAWN